MNISTQTKGNTLTLLLAGRMDFQSRKLFQQAIEKAKLARPRQIVLDFSQVPFINSAGLGLIMLTHRSLQEAEISFSLEVPEGYVMEVLTLANIGSMIPVSLVAPK